MLVRDNDVRLGRAAKMTIDNLAEANVQAPGQILSNDSPYCYLDGRSLVRGLSERCSDLWSLAERLIRHKLVLLPDHKTWKSRFLPKPRFEDLAVRSLIGGPKVFVPLSGAESFLGVTTHDWVGILGCQSQYGMGSGADPLVKISSV